MLRRAIRASFRGAPDKKPDTNGLCRGPSVRTCYGADECASFEVAFASSSVPRSSLEHMAPDHGRIQRRLNELRELCQQTERLHLAAERLLRELTMQIERTRQYLSRPVIERRRKPR